MPDGDAARAVAARARLAAEGEGQRQVRAALVQVRVGGADQMAGSGRARFGLDDLVFRARGVRRREGRWRRPEEEGVRYSALARPRCRGARSGCGSGGAGDGRWDLARSGRGGACEARVGAAEEGREEGQTARLQHCEDCSRPAGGFNGTGWIGGVVFAGLGWTFEVLVLRDQDAEISRALNLIGTRAFYLLRPGSTAAQPALSKRLELNTCQTVDLRNI